LLTDALAQQLTSRIKLDAPNVQVLPVKGDPKSLIELSQKQLDELRARRCARSKPLLLHPMALRFTCSATAVGSSRISMTKP
jgi:hypothetical protein